MSDTPIKNVGTLTPEVKGNQYITNNFGQQPPNLPTQKHISKFIPSDFPTKTKYFTGRQNVLEEIDNVLQTKGNASLAETHGVGKTSILLEYAFRNREKYSQVIFIRATNNEFDTQVSKVLDSLGFSLPNDAKPEQRLAVFQDWLAKNDNWLLLVDNVDDVAFIKDCKFNKLNGKVFYTSNDSQIFKISNKIELPKMLSENAMLLLYKHWQETEDAKFEDVPEKYREALKGIAEKFGNHPFSMAFVGSYLSAEDDSLDEFLEAYQKKEKNLLAKYSFITDYQHQEVATAFLLRFEQISTPKDESKREQFLATAVQDYLKLSAFLATDNIPEELLQQSLALLHPDQTKWTEDNDFIKDIFKRFKPTSIFKRDAEDKTLSTHLIVQEIMRTQIEDEEDIILKCLAQVLANNFEHFDFTNKEKVERYLSHVGVFLEYLEANKLPKQSNLKLENKSTALLCNSYARYFEQYGQYEKAIKYYELFKDICESAQDIDQNTLATSYNNLALLYATQGKYELAETYCLKALKIREKELGENHPLTATTYNNLAGLYKTQGKYELAETYHLKALKIREKELGENHPNTAQSYNNLGLLYKTQGKYELAETYYLKDLKISEKELGENHPDTATSYNNLGVLYANQGKFAEAKVWLEKALLIRQNILGEEHPDTINAKKSLEILEEMIKESES